MNAVAETNGVVYIGGDFHYVGPETGPNGFLDPATGARDDSFPQFDGAILTAIPDGAGGWFIGGNFSMVGGQAHSGLVHLLANKTVDSNWNVSIVPGGVSSMAVIGDNLYMAGAFFSIGGRVRSTLGAVSIATGLPTSWDPSPSGPFAQVNYVSALGSTVYVAGAFRNVGGQVRTNLAALDATTGNALAWSPNPNGVPTALLASGTSVYVGGNFQCISGQSRTNFAALDATTGNLLLGPHAVGGAVNGLGVIGNVLTWVDSSVRSELRVVAAWERSTSQLELSPRGIPGTDKWGTPMRPACSASVYREEQCTSAERLHSRAADRACVSRGSTAPREARLLHLTLGQARTFRRIGGIARTNFGAVDVATANAVAFPNPAYLLGSTYALGLRGRESLLVGGTPYQDVAGAAGGKLLELTLATGNRTAWDPGPERPGGLLGPGMCGH